MKARLALPVLVAAAAAATSACVAPNNIFEGGPPYMGDPPASTATVVGEVIRWDLLEGHLAWSRGPSTTIFVADAGHQKLTRLSYATNAEGIWEGSVALSPDASHLAFSAILNSTWPYRLFVSNVAGGKTEALVPLDLSMVEEWPAWTPDGLAIVFPQSSAFTKGDSSLTSIGSDGTGLMPLPVASSFGPAAFSPDGASLGVALGDGIYVVHKDGTGMRQLAKSPTGRVLYSPSWSRDGSQLAFVSRHGPNDLANGEPQQFQIFRTDLQGAAQAVVTFLFSGYPCDTFVSWGPGTKLAFNKCSVDADGGVHIYIADADTGESSPLTSGKVFEDAPSWVP